MPSLRNRYRVLDRRLQNLDVELAVLRRGGLHSVAVRNGILEFEDRRDVAVFQGAVRGAGVEHGVVPASVQASAVGGEGGVESVLE